MLMPAGALVALALVLTCFDVGVAQAQSVTAANAEAISARRKINLAGRQRMLTQNMAKASCFVGLDIDDKTHLNDVFAMHALFEQTLTDLRKGNAGLELLPEKDDEVLSALTAVGQEWQRYSRAVMDSDLKTIIALNQLVLKSADFAVTTVQRRYGALGNIRPELAAALNISGRQRMLSQKASKELCLIAAKEDPEANRRDLLATIELFERSLGALRDGDASLGLQRNADNAILALIKTGEETWSPLKSILERVAKGDTPSIEELETVAKLNISVLEIMNDIVVAYEAQGR